MTSVHKSFINALDGLGALPIHGIRVNDFIKTWKVSRFIWELTLGFKKVKLLGQYSPISTLVVIVGYNIRQSLLILTLEANQNDLSTLAGP